MSTINTTRVTNRALAKIRALPNFRQINANIKTELEAVRQRLLAEAYNKHVARKNKKQGDIITTPRSIRQVGIGHRGRPKKVVAESFEDTVARNHAHSSLVSKRRETRLGKHGEFTMYFDVKIMIEDAHGDEYEMTQSRNNRFRLSKKFSYKGVADENAKLLEDLKIEATDNYGFTKSPEWKQLTNGIDKNQVDELIERIKALLISKEMCLINVDNIEIRETHSETIDYANELAFDTGNPSYLCSQYMSLDGVVEMWKNETESLEPARSCCIKLVVDLYKDIIEKNYKSQIINYETVAYIFNPNKPLKDKDNGYAFHEYVNFFKLFRLSIYLLDVNLNVREFYETPEEERNKRISPSSVYVVYHQRHLYLLNHNIKSLCQTVKKEKYDSMKQNVDSLIKTPSFNYYVKKRNEEINSIMANNLLDIVSILNNVEMIGDLYVTYNRSDLYTLWHELYNIGIKAQPNMRGIRISFESITIYNVNGKTLKIVSIEEEHVTDTVLFDNKPEYDHYLSIKNWAHNRIIQKNYVSQYSDDVKQMLDLYVRGGLIGAFVTRPEPLFDTTSGTSTFEKVVEADFNKFYAAIIRDLPFVPIITNFDHYIPCPSDEVICGQHQYFVEKIVDNQSYPFNKFSLCWGFNILGNTNIKLIAKLSPTVIIKKDELLFHETIKKIYEDENLKPNQKKNIPNIMAGETGMKLNRRFHTHISTDEKEINTMLKEYGGIKIPFGEFWIHSVQKKTELSNGFRLIQSMIYDTAHKRLLDLKDKFESFGCAVYSCNTDCLNVSMDKFMEFKDANKSLFGDEIKGKDHWDNIGLLKWKIKDYAPKNDMVLRNTANYFPLIKHEFKPENIIKIDDEFNTDEVVAKLVPNTIIRASIPGAGKTYSFICMSKMKKTLFVTPFNALGFDLKRTHGLTAITVHSLLGISYDGNEENDRGSSYNVHDFDAIVFDEIFLYDTNKLSRIASYMKSHSTKEFYATGDDWQNSPIEPRKLSVTDVKKHYNTIIASMFPNVILFEKSKRCVEKDRERLYGLCNEIKNSRKSDIWDILKKYDIPVITDMKQVVTDKNICYTNETCDMVNNSCQKRLHPDEKYRVGSELICRQSYGKNKIRLYVNYTYSIVSIDGDMFVVTDGDAIISLTKGMIEKHMKLPYARTCHSFQGMTIKEPMTVFNIDHFFAKVEWIYTALTRASDLSFISVFKANDDGLKRLKPKIERMIAGHKAADAKCGRMSTGKYIDVKWVLAYLGENTTCRYCYTELDTDAMSCFSVDRIDNELPHTEDNCPIICRACNNGKK